MYPRTFPMPAGPRSVVSMRLRTRLFAVAAVVAITLLGNLRLQASEMRHPAAAGAAATDEASRVFVRAEALAEPAPVGTRAEVARPRSTKSAVRMEADAQDDDTARVVPAIYAWDPDVRFVFFRHVSKWM